MRIELESTICETSGEQAFAACSLFFYASGKLPAALTKKDPETEKTKSFLEILRHLGIDFGI